jgi:signal transduction histidine kinase
MPDSISRQEKRVNTTISIIFLVWIYLTSLYNYLLFHSLAELFSIVIACGIFMFAWNTRRHLESPYFLFLGIAYLFVGILDTLHTLSYEGMQVFTDYDYYATQLWIAARAMESISLLAAFYFLPQGRRLNVTATLSGFALITGLLVGSIFWWKIFPECFVEGEGLTTFKVVSEYVISAILVGAIVVLYRFREQFSAEVFRLILFSLIATIIAELAFTFYISHYGFSNLVGHIFKIISFKLIYEAIIATGLRAPHELLYRQLKQRELDLRQSNEIKARLFQIISHDLRSPFNSILGLSELLAQEYENTSEEEKKEFIGHINTTAHSTYTLLDNLLQWSTMQTNGILLKPEDLKIQTLVDGNLALKQESARQKGITLKSDIASDTGIYADPNMANTVLRNLLSNAIKFTHQGGEVSVSTETKDDHVEITITDTGTGMTEEEMTQLFNNNLNQSKPGTAQEKGTGLGLMLCMEFVEKHGGTIRVESAPGKGSRFIFTLPRNKQSLRLVDSQ